MTEEISNLEPENQSDSDPSQNLPADKQGEVADDTSNNPDHAAKQAFNGVEAFVKGPDGKYKMVIRYERVHLR
jgi:hypothetical protein